MKVAVVILNYNGKKMLEKFLPSVVKCTPEYAEVVVADNASTDDSLSFLAQNYPYIRTVVLDKNYGFAEGYNRAIKEIEADYILLLNSDVEVTKGYLDPLVSELDNNSDVVSVQPKVLAFYDKTRFEHAGASGGFIDCYGYPFCRGRVMDITELDNGQYDTPLDIQWTTGAAMLIRRNEYLNAGGLDESFFAHQEEIDLCWRLGARGWRLRCVPSSVVYHLGGGTLNMGSPRKTYLNFRNNLCLIYKNHTQKNKILFVRFFLDYFAALVFLAKGEFKNFIAVIKARIDYHKMKKSLFEKRSENIRLTKKDCNCVKDYFLLKKFYLSGIKHYSEL